MHRPAVADRYEPVAGGWQIRIARDSRAPRAAAGSGIGVVAPLPSSSGHEGNPESERRSTADDPRRHRRPLYPPADRTLLWGGTDLEALQRISFRPLVLAYLAPRFILDAHVAGGHLGHLRLGWVPASGPGAWLDDWSDIVVRYVDGRLDWRLADPAFPRTEVCLSAIALAGSVGLALRWQVTGEAPGTLVAYHGGASGFFSNYNFGEPEFTFSPGQCARDEMIRGDGAITLRRAFAPDDSIIRYEFAVPRRLPGWTAEVTFGGWGDGSDGARCGFARPDAEAGGPAALLAAAEFPAAAGERRNARLALVAVPVAAGAATGRLVLGMGGDVAAAARDPAAAERAARHRNAAIASRVTVRTPDPHLDAAVPSMAFSLEGTWGDTAYLHGAWSWRSAYLGWRGWYGPTCWGLAERVARSIRAHVALGPVTAGEDAGALGDQLERGPGVFYNMNEVFLDHVRQHVEYTGDLDLAREIFPVLEGILDWENRRLRPGDEPLYENSLNTWISDSHWNIRGQCTQASAYLLGAYRFLADLAARLGRDPVPFAARAAAIREAMQRLLWREDAGVFADWRDTTGHRLLHPEPELPTIYHAAEFGAADPVQVRRMLDWVDANLRREDTPGGGRMYWSSNWHPNQGRSYTHSTYELAFAEELNLALVAYQAGRVDEGYAILRASLCGVFSGPTPGGLSCHAWVDGRQRMNDEFADAISMWARTVVEGLFGIRPVRADRLVRLTPCFPSAWPSAEIRTPHFAYRWERGDGRERIDWSAPEETSVRLRLPVRAASVERVLVDGRPAACTVEQDVGFSWVHFEAGPKHGGAVEVAYAPLPAVAASPARRAPPASAPRTWQAPEGARDLSRWTLVDLSSAWNTPLVEAIDRVLAAARPPAPPASTVGFHYRNEHLGPRMQRRPSDAAWRAKVGDDGIAWTDDGIPFRSAREGDNIGVVTLDGGFPARLEVPVAAAGRTLYLMLSGITFPCQSHVANLRISLAYADGRVEAVDLANPSGIGDCWGTWLGRFHDTPANGFENLGGRFGPPGSRSAGDLSRPVAVDTEAHLVALPLRGGHRLERLAIEAVANDAIWGIMGASLLG